jgi:hypothetical protein
MQAHSFMQAIRDNQIGQFGLVKLSHLDVNQLHEPATCLPKDPCQDSHVWSPDFSLTLINFAALLGRDAIVAALLRAV